MRRGISLVKIVKINENITIKIKIYKLYARLPPESIII
jgi:hypothetical protein